MSLGGPAKGQLSLLKRGNPVLGAKASFICMKVDRSPCRHPLSGSVGSQFSLCAPGPSTQVATTGPVKGSFSRNLSLPTQSRLGLQHEESSGDR